MMDKLTKVCNSGIKLSIEFNVIYLTVDGTYSLLFKIYVAFLACSKVNILMDDQKEAKKKI